MFKVMMTLIRGRSHEAGEALADRHALTILDQQMRDAAASLDLARRALAVAIASDLTEAKRIAATDKRLADLEERAMAALQGGREDLASQAAEAIATLEADRMSGCEARKTFATEISRLKRDVAGAEGRFADLERGRRIARAVEAVRRLRNGPAGQPANEGALAEAEATLARLRAKQAESEAAAGALEALNSAALSTNIAEVLAVAGFGAKTRPDAEDILNRLKRRAAASRMAG